MKNKITLIFENFEKISESQEHNLVGGFSKSFSNQNEISFSRETNNCIRGNCFSGCGDENIQCNTVAGCGVKQ